MMTEVQLDVLVKELGDELQLDLDASSDLGLEKKLKRHLENGAFFLKSKIGEFNIETNRTARQYVINYARYGFYGVLDEFYVNYQSDLRGLQIENFES